MMLVFNILILLKGELQHEDSKSAYANSNKGPNKDFQIVRRAFQRHKMDGIRRANNLRKSGPDLRRPTEKMQGAGESSSRLQHSETPARHGL